MSLSLLLLTATLTVLTTEPKMPTYSRAGFEITPLSSKEKEPLVSKLSPEAKRITQKAGTERPFCGTLLDNKKDGFYACVVCGLPLFTSDHKFTSGTGWPSFFAPFDPDHVGTETDDSNGMIRIEIMCVRCDSHLGHVFDDGPKPTGKRFCLNSASLHFFEQGDPLPDSSKPIPTETAYFAGGCFWGLEHYFQQGEGVINVISGYMQGQSEDPTYKEICSGKSGHAETTKVVFNPKVISYEELLEAFFKMHDPTQVNRQGPDRGTQYRSGIWANTESQLNEATAFASALENSKKFDKPIATEIELAKTFYPAEQNHQDYIERTGRTCHVTNPWKK